MIASFWWFPSLLRSFRSSGLGRCSLLTALLVLCGRLLRREGFLLAGDQATRPATVPHLLHQDGPGEEHQPGKRADEGHRGLPPQVERSDGLLVDLVHPNAGRLLLEHTLEGLELHHVGDFRVLLAAGHAFLLVLGRLAGLQALFILQNTLAEGRTLPARAHLLLPGPVLELLAALQAHLVRTMALHRSDHLLATAVQGDGEEDQQA